MKFLGVKYVSQHSGKIHLTLPENHDVTNWNKAIDSDDHSMSSIPKSMNHLNYYV